MYLVNDLKPTSLCVSLSFPVFQLRGPRPAFQSAAGPLRTVLCVGRALQLPELAGGVLSHQQHRKGANRFTQGP